MMVNSSVQSMRVKISLQEIVFRISLGYQEYIFTCYSLSINVKIFYPSLVRVKEMGYIWVKVCGDEQKMGLLGIQKSGGRENRDYLLETLWMVLILQSTLQVLPFFSLFSSDSGVLNIRESLLAYYIQNRASSNTYSFTLLYLVSQFSVPETSTKLSLLKNNYRSIILCQHWGIC